MCLFLRGSPCRNNTHVPQFWMISLPSWGERISQDWIKFAGESRISNFSILRPISLFMGRGESLKHFQFEEQNREEKYIINVKCDLYGQLTMREWVSVSDLGASWIWAMNLLSSTEYIPQPRSPTCVTGHCFSIQFTRLFGEWKMAWLYNNLLKKSAGRINRNLFTLKTEG